VFDQSENRLHAEAGILVYTTCRTLPPPPSPELAAYHQDRIETFMRGAGMSPAPITDQENVR
jgi:hypothetical protein